MGDIITFLWDTMVFLVSLLTSLVTTLYHLVVPPVQKSVVGEVAVVTGAGQGIGREIAKQLAVLGVKVACWDVKEKEVKEVVEDIVRDGGEAIAVIIDVTDKDEIKKAAAQTEENQHVGYSE